MKSLFGICPLSLLPLRAEPSHRSEMVSQILFGEIFMLLEERNGWMNVQLKDDGYIGWVEQKCFEPIDESFVTNYLNQPRCLASGFAAKIINHSRGETLTVFRGSSLPFFNDSQVQLAQQQLYFEGIGTAVPKTLQVEKIIPTALDYMGTPYLWGGRTVSGIDCSGLTQMVFRQCGIWLPRDAYQQAEMGVSINFIDECQAGDLLFFDNADGKITHVGMATGKGEIIHASGSVRKDLIDHQGIFNKNLNAYTHNMMLIKRLK